MIIWIELTIILILSQFLPWQKGLFLLILATDTCHKYTDTIILRLPSSKITICHPLHRYGKKVSLGWLCLFEWQLFSMSRTSWDYIASEDQKIAVWVASSLARNKSSSIHQGYSRLRTRFIKINMEFGLPCRRRKLWMWGTAESGTFIGGIRHIFILMAHLFEWRRGFESCLLCFLAFLLMFFCYIPMVTSEWGFFDILMWCAIEVVHHAWQWQLLICYWFQRLSGDCLLSVGHSLSLFPPMLGSS